MERVQHDLMLFSVHRVADVNMAGVGDGVNLKSANTIRYHLAIDGQVIELIKIINLELSGKFHGQRPEVHCIRPRQVYLITLATDRQQHVGRWSYGGRITIITACRQAQKHKCNGQKQTITFPAVVPKDVKEVG